jgi:hypothetical protein
MESSLVRDLIENYYSYMLRESEMSTALQQGGKVRADGSRSAVVLEQFSTRLPPDVLARLRIAAPQLGLRQAEIAATAIDRFLKRRGF